MNKKTLIALAALAAGSAALAQSSVTLYGVADVGIGKGEGGKVNMISGTVINNSNSYIGLRGVEDMGGGLKAGFNLEQIINMENGTVGVAAADSPTWQRAANVWLGGNWGRLRMGLGTTPSHNAMLAWDLMGLPNYAPAIYSFGHVGGNAASRNVSLFSYKTSVWGGFSAELGYIAKGDDQVQGSQKDKFDLGVTYVNGPLSAGAAYNKTKSYKANYGLGAKYNFGSFTLAASYQDSNNWAFGSTPGAVGRVAGVTLGGMVNFGAMSVALDVVRQLKNEATFQNVVYKGKKYTDGALELKYALSKRTFFYGAYLRVEGANNYSLGMQHRF